MGVFVCVTRVTSGATGPVQGASVGMAAALEEDREQRFAARDEAQQAQRAEQRRLGILKELCVKILHPWCTNTPGGTRIRKSGWMRCFPRPLDGTLS